MSKIVRAFPLTPLQEGMLYHALRFPDSGLYHGQLAATLEGPLDPEHFRRAWAHAAARHEVFRTFFTWEKRDRPLQVVRSEVELPIRFLDWRDLEPPEATRRWAALLEEDRHDPLDLTQAPMMRLTVAHLSADRHEFLWGVHHSILDGWSGELVLGEVLDDVAALGRGEVPQRRSAPSYADFVGWLEAQSHDEVRSWWREELAGVRQTSRLPVPETGRSSSRRLTTERRLSEDETHACRSAAAQRRVTLASLTVAAWSILLARRTGTRDALFGITMSERPAEIPGVHEAAGLYLSTIPARVPIDPSALVADWLPDVQRRSSEARSRASLGLSELKRLSEVEGPEWIRSLVVFENFPESIAHTGEEGALRIGQVSMAGPSDLPLALLVYPSSVLTLQIVHDPEQVSVEQAEVLLVELAEILERLGSGAETVADLVEGAAAFSSEPAAVPEEWTRGPEIDREAPDVIELFDHQVAAKPERVALQTEDQSLTYGELHRQADEVARYVRARTPAEGGVGILAPRGVDAIAAMLGVLKAGRHYMPLDPGLPPVRIAAMAASADLVLTSGGHDAPAAASGAPVSSIVAARATPSDGAVDPPAIDAVRPEAAAYVIHTSGSTGTPKGVVIERRHLAWSTAARLDHYEEHPGVFLLLSAISVDSSVAGIYWTLCSGGTLVLPARRAEQDVVGLGALIRAAGVSHMLMVPSLYRALLSEVDPEALSSLRTVVVAGEACAPDVVRSHRAVLPGVPLYNEYGPSEASVWATVDELTSDPLADVTIGRPVPGARAWVLDSDRRPVAVGEVGELVLGGPGIARGYLNRPDLTRERFFGYAGADGTRAYHTGDRARWRPDGRLDFLGRTDDQIKVRGYRVEVAEVERALALHPGIEEAVVGLSTHTGRELLTAWVSAAEPPSETSLRTHLEGSLPDYMVPQRFVLAEALPRTAAGKIDRRALQETTGLDLAGEPAIAAHIAPRSATERALAEVWSEVLGVSDIGVHDDFFSLGGDSLLSIRVISRAARAGFRVDPEGFFENPTIAHIAQLAAGDTPSDDFAVATGAAPLTPIQHWFIETMTRGRNHWNQAEVLELPPGTEPGRVERAVRGLLDHHDALRLRLDLEASPPRQIIDAPETTPPFRTVDLGGADGDAERRFAEEADREHLALDLSAGRLFRAVFFTGDDSARLLLVAHHLVVDAVSWSLILEDLATLLGATAPPALPGKTASFLTWADALRRRASDPDVADMATHWTAPTTPVEWTRVPCDFSGVEGAARVSTSRVQELAIDSDTTARLSPRPGGADAPSLHRTLLAALALAWGRWTGREGLQLHVEGLGRDTLRGQLDVSRTVGWFTSAYPLRLPLPRPTVDAAKRSVQAAVDALPLGGAAYGLGRYLHPDAALREKLDAAGSAELLFNFLGSVDGALSADAPFVRAEGPRGRQRSLDAPRAYHIEINARLEQGRLRFAIEYSSALHRPASITAFSSELRGALGELATSVSDRPAFELVDLDEAGLAGAGLEPAAGVEDAYPLTPMQDLMLLHEMGGSDRALLANQISYDVHGPIDEEVLRQALGRLIERHPSLRSGVLWEGLDEPLQVVRKQVRTPLEVVDLREVAGDRSDAGPEARRAADEVAPIDISLAPLMRVTLIRLSAEHARLVWTLHHLVADRWSFGRIVGELGQLYRSILDGASASLPSAPPFRDYVAWLRRADHRATDAFWARHLAGMTRPSRVAPLALTHPGKRERTSLTLPTEVAESLERAAAGARVGQSAFVLGALALEVARRTARLDVVVGLTVSGRPPELAGIEEMVGSFVNNVPMRVRIDPRSTRDAWLRELQLDQIRRQPHEHHSLARIHGLSQLRASDALFDLLAVINLDPVDDPDFGPLAVRPIGATLDGGYPLILEIARVGSHLRLQLVHPEGFEDASALLDGLGRTLQVLLGSSGADPLERAVHLPEPADEPSADPAPDPTPVAEPATATPSDPARMIRAAWTEVLGVEDAHPGDDFFAMGGTSLQGAQLLARIEIGIGRRIPIAVLVSGRTLGALLDTVEALPAETGPLVVLRRVGSRPPLVAVPGVGGNLLLYPHFAERLRPGRPVYGLQSRGVDGEHPFLGSMEAIATDFVDQLGDLTREPLHLFGLCWGAAAAFEVAAVLEARGTPPASVSLLDPTALGLKVGADGRARTRGRVGFLLDRLMMYVDEFRALPWAGRRRMLAEKASRISRAIAGRTEEATQVELRQRAVIEANLRALERYRPATISTPARVFLAEDFEPDYGSDHRTRWLDHFEPSASVVTLPGFDSGDVIKTHTAALTEAVDAWLDHVEGLVS